MNMKVGISGWRILAALLFAVACGQLLYADELPVTEARHVSEALQIDGRLDEKAWNEKGQWQRLGSFAASLEKELRPQETKFAVHYDENALYIGIRCSEPWPGKIKTQTFNYDSAVYMDDSVEVFIDPSGLGSDYYHFAFNTASVCMDLYGSEKGNLKETSYNAVVEAKSFIGGDYWSMEIRIPYTAFNRTDLSRLTDKWRVNICRNRFAGNTGEMYTWAPVRYSYHDPDRFGIMKFAGKEKLNLSRFNYRFTPLTLSVKSGEKSGFRVSFTTEITNLTRQKKSLRYKGSVIGLPEGSLTSEKTIVDGAADQLVVEGISVPEKGEYQFVVQVYDTDAVFPCAVYRQAAVVNYSRFAIDIIEPFYGNAIYPDEKIDRITGKLIINDRDLLEGARGSVVLKKDDIVIDKVDFTSLAGEPEFKLNAVALKAGSYLVEAVLRDNNGKVIDSQKQVIRKLPEFKGTITRVDKDLNLVVNGKPVIAAGWYAYEYLMGQSRQRVGFETSRKENISLGISLDEAAQRNMLGLANLELRLLCPGLNTKKDGELPQYAKDKVRAVMESVKHHPGLGGYYLCDEPSCQGASPVLLRNLYEYVKELDPYHVTIIIDRNPAMYIDCADIYAPDPYLTPMQSIKSGERWMRIPMTDVRDKMRDVLRFGNKKKGPWVVPATFSYRYLMEEAVHHTFQEERCMLYIALANGSKGFMAYTRFEAFEEYDVRMAVQSFYEELFHLETALTAGKRLNVKVDSPGDAVDCSAIEYNGKLYIVAANTSPKPQETNFTVAIKGRDILKVIREDRTRELKEGCFTDTFEGYGTHLYTTDMSFPYLDTLKEILAEIEWKKRHTRDSLIFNDQRVIVRTNDARKAFNSLALHNGTIDSPAWISTAPPAGDTALWLELSWPDVQKISRIEVYSNVNLIDYDVQGLVKGRWVTLAQVKDNYLQKREHRFQAIETVKIRLVIHKPRKGAEVNEIAVYKD